MVNHRLSFRICVLLVIATVSVQACAPTPAINSGPTKREPATEIVKPTQAPTVIPTSEPTAAPMAWTQLWDGNEMARDIVTAVALDPKNPAVIYAGTEDSGLYKTSDGGATWKPIQTGMNRALVRSLAVDPVQTDTVYAGFDGEILQTTDGGESWEPAALGIKDELCFGAILLPETFGREKMYFADNSCLFAREGMEWIRVKAGDCPNNIASVAVHPTDSNLLLVAERGESKGDCPSGVYLSEDGGRAWSLLHTWSQEATAVGWLVDTDGNEDIYAITRSFNGELFVSSDRGASWKSVKTFVRGLAPTASGYLIAYSGNSLYKVADHGNSWEELSSPAESFFHTVVVSSEDPNQIYLGGGSLLGSTDGGRTWAEMGGGIGAVLFDVHPAPGDPSILYAQRLFRIDSFGATTSQLFRSSDAGQTWKLITEDGVGLALDADGQTLYRFSGGKFDNSWEHYLLLRSPDRGETWQELSSLSLPKTAVLGMAAHPTIVGKIYARIVRTDNHEGFLVSTNRGGFWQGLDWKWEGIKPQTYDYMGADLVILPVQDKAPQMFVFESNGGNNIFRSTDEGGSWSRCGSMEFPKDRVRFVSRLIPDPRDPNHLFFTLNDILYSSSNGCASWEPLASWTGSQPINSLAIDPNNPDAIYAGTDTGAYVSRDGAQTWSRIDDGFNESAVIYSILVDSRSNVYAATPGGIFMLDAS